MEDQNQVQTILLNEVDWDDIIESLKGQKCMLFFGQGIYEASDGNNHNKALRLWLDAENPNHPQIHVYNADGFFLFKKGRLKVISAIRKFYDQKFPETEKIFEKIARLPFPAIFSLMPDNLLARTFDVLGLEYQRDFYIPHKKASEYFEQPSPDNPLIYNLIGNIENPNSLLLTHQNFFDYLNSIFIGNSMNVELKEWLDSFDRYIFLGLPYEKWYFQLLLRVLSLISPKLKDIEPIALKEFENPNLQKIYTEEFKIDFYDASAKAFIEELYQRSETAGILKPLPTIGEINDATPDATEKELIELVATAKTGKALDRLKTFLHHRKPATHDLANSLLLLSNRFHLLRQREMKGTIDSRDLSVEDNKIVESLIQLITEAQKYR